MLGLLFPIFGEMQYFRRILPNSLPDCLGKYVSQQDVSGTLNVFIYYFFLYASP
jgi:hypothetical protein